MRHAGKQDTIRKQNATKAGAPCGQKALYAHRAVAGAAGNEEQIERPRHVRRPGDRAGARGRRRVAVRD